MDGQYPFCITNKSLHESVQAYFLKNISLTHFEISEGSKIVVVNFQVWTLAYCSEAGQELYMSPDLFTYHLFN